MKEYIKSIEELAEEKDNEKSLPELVERPFRVYDGFEPSGKIHLMQGLGLAHKVNTYTSNPHCTYILYIADIFAKLNLKCEGDLGEIKKHGERMIEVWKACGMNMDQVKIIWASDHITHDYMMKVLHLSTGLTVKRVERCCTALGKKSKDALKLSQLLYAVMQCMDSATLGIDIITMGVDQRKVSMLVLEQAHTMDIKPPVILSHHMLLGLDGTKMSKSNPDSAIFIEDTPEIITRKLNKAFCPPKAQDNPVFELIKYVLLPHCKKIHIQRNEKYGGDVTYSDMDVLEKDLISGNLSPVDLKLNVTRILIDTLKPIQERLSK